MSVRVAVVGAGYFAQFHHEVWARLPDAKLVGIADLDPTKVAKVASVYGVPAFADAENMFDPVAPDLADIVTPPVVTAIAGRGVPAICQ